MIFRCKCGSLKTGQPYRASGETPWICEPCSPAKQSRRNMQVARDAAGGRYHRHSEPAGDPRS